MEDVAPKLVYALVQEAFFTARMEVPWCHLVGALAPVGAVVVSPDVSVAVVADTERCVLSLETFPALNAVQRCYFGSQGGTDPLLGLGKVNVAVRANFCRAPAAAVLHSLGDSRGRRCTGWRLCNGALPVC